MGFYEEHHDIIASEIEFDNNRNKVDHVISLDRAISIEEYKSLLSHESKAHLEGMARKAHLLTMQYFGKVVQLYTPIYLSNYCINGCKYCNFNTLKNISRIKLEMSEIEEEARIISQQGFRHILILTGEDRQRAPLSYIKDAMRILKKYFRSISIEIYPLEEKEYKELVDEGLDGLTVYQEVYDKEVYSFVHPFGPKKDYFFRLNAPERAAKAGVRTINIGSLLGLNDYRYESFVTGLHAKYLQEKYSSCDISVSTPRLRPYGGDEFPSQTVSDSDLVQIITALRIFLPRVGVTLSTRESQQLRDNILPLGVTRISAGSDTSVGGRLNGKCDKKNDAQFDISDSRDMNAIKTMLKEKGYQPVHQDWFI